MGFSNSNEKKPQQQKTKSGRRSSHTTQPDEPCTGKSVSSLAVMGLLPPTARVEAQRLTFAGTDLLSLSGRARRRLTGKDVAMVFQDPLTSLNPCYTIGFQIIEALKVH